MRSSVLLCQSFIGISVSGKTTRRPLVAEFPRGKGRVLLCQASLGTLLADEVRGDGYEEAAKAIMTTDTVPKRETRTFRLGERTATVTGIATEPEALRAVGWAATPAGLRRLRDDALRLPFLDDGRHGK